MNKRDDQAEIREVERAFNAIGDTLRRAAQNPDALDLKPDAKAWLLDHFGTGKPKFDQYVTDKELGYAREIIRQQEELDQQTKPTTGKSHVEQQQRRKKSKQTGGDLPPH